MKKFPKLFTNPLFVSCNISVVVLMFCKYARTMLKYLYLCLNNRLYAVYNKESKKFDVHKLQIQIQ